MKFFRNITMLAVAGTLAAAPLTAQDSETTSQTVTFEVSSIKAMSVSGDPGKLTISGANAGSGPISATDASTTWAITTNESNMKVTGAIDLAMPADVTLSADLAAPAGATAVGKTALTATAADLVTGIATAEESGLTTTYTLDALTSAGVVAEENRTVTFTLTAGA